jgi:hypothetical protein
MRKLQYTGRDAARRVGSLAIFTALLVFTGSLLLAQPGATPDDSLVRAQAALAALKAAVQNGRIGRAEVFAMPYRVESPIAMTPDMLAAERKVSVELNRKLRDELIRAIDGAELQIDKWGSDLRWGAIFLDRAGTPLHSIYLNSCYYGGAGRRGYIDGIQVRLNGSLIVWFESNFSNDSQPCANGPSG